MGIFGPFLAYFSNQNWFKAHVNVTIVSHGHSEIIIIMPGDFGGHRTSINQKIVNLAAKNPFF